MADRLRRRKSDQTVLGSNPAVAATLSPWTRLFTPIAPRRSLHTLASISYLAILVKYIIQKNVSRGLGQSTQEPSCSWLLGEPVFFFYLLG